MCFTDSTSSGLTRFSLWKFHHRTQLEKKPSYYFISFRLYPLALFQEYARSRIVSLHQLNFSSNLLQTFTIQNIKILCNSLKPFKIKNPSFSIIPLHLATQKLQKNHLLSSIPKLYTPNNSNPLRSKNPGPKKGGEKRRRKLNPPPVTTDEDEEQTHFHPAGRSTVEPQRVLSPTRPTRSR